VSVAGTALRLAGTQVGDVRVIAAQTLGSVSDAQSTLLLAESVIAPILLAAVFAGAVLVGRRVASPVEAARRRQVEFTADASHELRTPLSVIEAHTSLGLATDRSTEWYRGSLERIDGEARRMRRLLEDMLWLARFDATRAPGQHEPVDLATIAEATVERFKPVAEARGLTLSAAPAAGTATVVAPAEWLDRLVAVLVDNACKYAAEGGTVNVHVSSERGRAILSVDDSGPGIPKAERERIFDRFHRATDQRGGAGLGLAIADAVVRATGGAWQVGTSPDGGARMSVSWPEHGGPRTRQLAGRGGSTSAEGPSAPRWSEPEAPSTQR
jgi:signal transduction histidine kinase